MKKNKLSNFQRAALLTNLIQSLALAYSIAQYTTLKQKYLTLANLSREIVPKHLTLTSAIMFFFLIYAFQLILLHMAHVEDLREKSNTIMLQKRKNKNKKNDKTA